MYTHVTTRQYQIFKEAVVSSKLMHKFRQYCLTGMMCEWKLQNLVTYANLTYLKVTNLFYMMRPTVSILYRNFIHLIFTALSFYLIALKQFLLLSTETTTTVYIIHVTTEWPATPQYSDRLSEGLSHDYDQICPFSPGLGPKIVGGRVTIDLRITRLLLSVAIGVAQPIQAFV